MQRFEPGLFPVASVLDRRVSDLTLIETRYRPGQALSRHAHRRAYVVVLVKGSFTETHARGSRTCAAPALLVRPAGEPHANLFGAGGGRVLNIEIPDGWAIGGPAVTLPRSSQDIDGPERERLALGFLHECFAGAGGASTLSVMVASALAAANRGACLPAASGAALRARRWVEADFQAPWSLSGLAAAIGMHPASLAKAFRRTYGESLGQFVRRLRVRAACRLLLRPEARLADVAQAVGFWDQAHFNRCFRAVAGITPGAYARLMAD